MSRRQFCRLLLVPVRVLEGGGVRVAVRGRWLGVCRWGRGLCGGCDVWAYRRLRPGSPGHDVDTIDWRGVVLDSSRVLCVVEVDLGEDFGFPGTLSFDGLG